MTQTDSRGTYPRHVPPMYVTISIVINHCTLTAESRLARTYCIYRKYILNTHTPVHSPGCEGQVRYNLGPSFACINSVNSAHLCHRLCANHPGCSYYDWCTHRGDRRICCFYRDGGVRYGVDTILRNYRGGPATCMAVNTSMGNALFTAQLKLISPSPPFAMSIPSPKSLHQEGHCIPGK